MLDRENPKAEREMRDRMNNIIRIKMVQTEGPNKGQVINVDRRNTKFWPAGALTRSMIKKKGTYLIKCECPDCGYVVRTTAKWLELGDPICPVDNVGMN